MGFLDADKEVGGGGRVRKAGGCCWGSPHTYIHDPPVCVEPMSLLEVSLIPEACICGPVLSCKA